jgi:hypothetical protein
MISKDQEFCNNYLQNITGNIQGHHWDTHKKCLQSVEDNETGKIQLIEGRLNYLKKSKGKTTWEDLLKNGKAQFVTRFWSELGFYPGVIIKRIDDVLVGIIWSDNYYTVEKLEYLFTIEDYRANPPKFTVEGNPNVPEKLLSSIPSPNTLPNFPKERTIINDQYYYILAKEYKAQLLLHRRIDKALREKQTFPFQVSPEIEMNNNNTVELKGSNVAGDGWCMYRSIASGINYILGHKIDFGVENRRKTPSSYENALSELLRLNAVLQLNQRWNNYVASNPIQYQVLSLQVDPSTGLPALMTGEDLACLDRDPNYILKMLTENLPMGKSVNEEYWGDAPEQWMMQHIIPEYILQTYDTRVMKNEPSPVQIVYQAMPINDKPVLFIWKNGNHYWVLYTEDRNTQKRGFFGVTRRELMERLMRNIHNESPELYRRTYPKIMDWIKESASATGIDRDEREQNKADLKYLETHLPPLPPKSVKDTLIIQSCNGTTYTMEEVAAAETEEEDDCDDDQRLINACDGKSAKECGYNSAELKKLLIAKFPEYADKIKKLNKRSDLNDICKELLLSPDIEDILKQVEKESKLKKGIFIYWEYDNTWYHAQIKSNGEPMYTEYILDSGKKSVSPGHKDKGTYHDGKNGQDPVQLGKSKKNPNNFDFFYAQEFLHGDQLKKLPNDDPKGIKQFNNKYNPIKLPSPAKKPKLTTPTPVPSPAKKPTQQVYWFFYPDNGWFESKKNKKGDYVFTGKWIKLGTKTIHNTRKDKGHIKSGSDQVEKVAKPEYAEHDGDYMTQQPYL